MAARKSKGIIKMKRIALVLCVALSGCTASYHREQLTGAIASTSENVLAPESLVYVPLPADGAYGEKTYSGSGKTTQQAVAAALAKHRAHVVRGDKVESVQQATAS